VRRRNLWTRLAQDTKDHEETDTWGKRRAIENVDVARAMYGTRQRGKGEGQFFKVSSSLWEPSRGEDLGGEVEIDDRRKRHLATRGEY